MSACALFGVQEVAASFVRALQDGAVEVVVACMNALFEVYCDEDQDAEFFGAGLLAACEESSRDLQRRVSVPRRCRPTLVVPCATPPSPHPRRVDSLPRAWPWVAQVRAEGKSWDRDLRNNAREALLNMKQFIVYKRAHQPSA